MWGKVGEHGASFHTVRVFDQTLSRGLEGHGSFSHFDLFADDSVLEHTEVADEAK